MKFKFFVKMKLNPAQGKNDDHPRPHHRNKLSPHGFMER